MTETHLRLTPSEFGALWTYLDNRSSMEYIMFSEPKDFMEYNNIELIEEHDPDFRPRYENGILTVDPLFRTWLATLSDRGTQALLRSIQ